MNEKIEGFVKAITAYGGDCESYEGYYSEENAMLFLKWLKDQPKVKDTTLYRGYTFNASYFNDGCYDIGAIIGVDALTQESLPSFTSEMVRACRYINDFGEIGFDDTVRVLFTINTHGVSFVDISSMSYYPEEKEFKCLDDVRLKVTSIKKRGAFVEIALDECRKNRK